MWFGGFPDEAKVDKFPRVLAEALTGFQQQLQGRRQAVRQQRFDVASQAAKSALKEPGTGYSLQQIQGRRQVVSQQVLILIITPTVALYARIHIDVGANRNDELQLRAVAGIAQRFIEG